MTRLPRVLVIWRDIVSDPEWRDAADAARADCALCETVGFLLRADPYKGVIIVGHSVSEIPGNGNGGTKRGSYQSDTTVIPWGAVEAIYRLKRAGKVEMGKRMRKSQ